MHTMVPLILFALLYLSAISTADNISSCFGQDRSVVGQYSNRERCTCTEARQRALTRARIRPTEFVPICKKNGKFSRTQTCFGNPKTFCVDEEFKVVGFGSDCRASPDLNMKIRPRT